MSSASAPALATSPTRETCKTKVCWSKDSWRRLPRLQMPEYPDNSSLQAAERQLERLPPLVFAGEARALQRRLAKATRGQGFVLQGGDCAESFAHYSAESIRDLLKVILEMAVVLTFSATCPVVKIGRVAGQFAKPRSKPSETHDGQEIPIYRGDSINDLAPNATARTPDPQRMIRAYHQSSGTLNLLRAFTQGGFADLRKVHQWTHTFVKESPQYIAYRDIAQRITEAIAFMEACGITSKAVAQVRETDFYTSHEALLLNYEEALTRQDSISGEYYDCSAHLLWLGERTRSPEGAHADFLRGVCNPLGVKCSADARHDELLRLLDLLNPDNHAGRVSLIVRMGADKIDDALPPLLRRLTQEGREILWICDPMHGNTVKAANGYKTRSFQTIMREIETFFAVHRAEGTWPGGIHLEMTGDSVTECIGGARALKEANLADRYHTHCDPRLNAEQALEIGFLVADLLAKHQNNAT